MFIVPKCCIIATIVPLGTNPVVIYPRICCEAETSNPCRDACYNSVLLGTVYFKLELSSAENYAPELDFDR
jgi:hypothetical protein